MSRIIFVPQYPTPMRYQQWWFTEFPKEFEKAGFAVEVLGNNKLREMKLRRGTAVAFSPINASIEFECAQIDEYMDLKLKDDDILFLADISFPGFFTNALYHKKPKRCFAYCHATSLNHKDYFEDVRYSKYPVESGHAKLFDTVFVGSNYHESKLNWRNTLVTRLPYPPLKTFNEKKELLLVSASRPTPQKVDLDLECSITERLNFPIVREEHDSWEDYYRFLSKSRVLIITSFEDTFGYQIVDAVMNNCIPLAPTRCSYPEILPRIYLYEDEDELLRRLDYIINSDQEVKVPKLLCHGEMENFFSNIIQVLKGEVEPDYPF
jgi:glycosyltransferase involved in cell wall biosynthesis